MDSPYDILGVSEKASEREIRNAYYDKMRQYHPDARPGDNNAEMMVRKINSAYKEIKGRRKNNFDESKFDVGRNDSDELRKCKIEYKERISLFKYIDSSYYFMAMASADSVDEVLKLYGDAKKENAHVLLVEIRKKLIMFNFISELQKNNYLQTIAQIIRKSNGDYNEKVINNIESIYLNAVRENAILGIEHMKLLDSDDRRQYLTDIDNGVDVDTISNILSKAIMYNYKQSVILSIKQLDFLSRREKNYYLLSAEAVNDINELKNIGTRAVKHNKEKRDGSLSSKMRMAFSSAFDFKGKNESGRRKI